MNKWMIPVIAVVVIAGLQIPNPAQANENAFIKEELEAEKTKDHPFWIQGLKTQHHLTDDHIQFMKGHGLTYPQMAIASRLSEKSGKTVDDILEMRSQKKMTWEKIAEELEVNSVEGISSISAIRQEINQNATLEIKNARND